MTEDFAIVSYSSSQIYYNLICRLAEICKNQGIPFKPYNREWLENQPERIEHKDIFTARHGGGYWAWKPLIILDALKSIDTVVYMDSSVIFNSAIDIQRIMDTTECLSAVQTSYPNKDWTKRSCFRVMGCDTEEYWNAPQVWAGVVCAKRCGIGIVEEWKKYCLNSDAVSDNKCSENFPTFRAHRHDQSILTNLLVKHKQFHVDTSGIRDS